MDTIARWVTLGLGHLTFGALHLFEKLGVNMATIDETLASWTARDKDLVSKLKDALASIQNLKDTDAAEDKAQADAYTAEVETKVKAAFDAVVATPETGDVDTDAPATDEPAVPATDPVPPVGGTETTPPAPFDDLPATPVDEPVEDAPVVEDTEAR